MLLTNNINALGLTRVRHWTVRARSPEMWRCHLARNIFCLHYSPSIITGEMDSATNPVMSCLSLNVHVEKQDAA